MTDLNPKALEAAARAFALHDSREYILSTSDASELHHASDGNWPEYKDGVAEAIQAYLAALPASPAPAGPYYAEDGKVWKRPEHKPLPEGGERITVGFPVCTMTPIVGPEAAETVASLMNLGAAAPHGDRA